MTKRRRHNFEPFCVYDVFGFVRKLWVAAEAHPDGYYVVAQEAFGPLTILDIGEAQVGPRYGRSVAPVAPRAQALKAAALREGATPEAIRLLRTMVSVTKEEESDMAEKLKGKGKLPSAGERKQALKEAAAAAPAVKAKEPKAAAPAKKGNPEALAKARAAKAANGGANVDRPYKVKVKDNPGRAGTWTHRMLEIIMAHTSTAEASKALAKDKTYGAKKLDFSWADKKGYIALGK